MTALNCPTPDQCPVLAPDSVNLRRLRTTTVEAGTSFYSVYWRRFWPKLFNPSRAGDTRFSPVPTDGPVVPTLYGARSRTCALLETAFHEVFAGSERIISESIDLAPRGLVRLVAPQDLKLFDLRDPALARLEVPREALVLSLPLHYRCTREWAGALHGRGSIGGSKAVGLIWESRVAELARGASPLLDDLLDAPTAEVFMLFGDEVPTDPELYSPSDRYENLAGAEARPLVEQIATHLGAVIESNR